MSTPRHHVHPDAAAVAHAPAVATPPAGAVVPILTESSPASGHESICFYGGTAGVATDAAHAPQVVVWDCCTIYFGSGRFFPAGDPESNDGQLDSELPEE